MNVNFDHHRGKKTGIDEVILSEPKQNVDLEIVISKSLEKNSKVLLTRIKKDQIEIIEIQAKFHDKTITWDTYHRTAIIGILPNLTKEPSVAIISGGTSDQPIVEEIKMCLNYFGINSVTYPDVGVAGIHRHQEVLKNLQKIPTIKILIVVAGNEGALFSVISGQTMLPIVAVPVSIGYGFGGKGLTALQSALQSCSPGVVVVNIDNGFGAAAFAKKLMNIQS